MSKRIVIAVVLLTLVTMSVVVPAALAEQKKELTLITYHSPGQTMNKILDMYAEATGTEVTFLSVPYAMYHDKVAMGLFSGVANWDLMWTWQAWTTEFEPYLADITSLIPKELRDDVDDASATATVINGRWYGAPLFLSIFGLYYNEEMFEQAGLDTPENLDELAAAASRLTRDIDGDGIIDVYGFAREGAGMGMFSCFVQMIQCVGGELLRSDGDRMVPAFNNEYGQRALERLKELYVSEWVDPSAVNSLAPDIRKAFAAGKVAMVCEGIGSVESFMRAEFPDMLDKVGLCVFPGDLGTEGALPGAVRSASFPGSMGLAVHKATPNLDTAVDFIQFMLSPEMQRFSMKDYGFVTVRKSMVNDAALVEEYPFIPAAFEQAKYPHQRWADEYYNAMQEALTPIIQSYVIGILSVDKALQQMETEVIKIRSEK